MTIRRFHFLLPAILLLAISLPGQGLPLEVVNRSTQPVSGEPVSLGVPFPETSPPITSWNQMGLVVKDASGQAVPTQFKALSRWGGPRDDVSKPLKWVLVTFPADVPAQGTATYYLSVGVRPQGQVTLSSTPTLIHVSTRPGNLFQVDKSAFRLFRSVEVDGQVLVAAPGGGLEMRDVNGNPIVPQVTETAVEESGSVRVVIRQRGTLGALRWTCRWYFHTGRDDVTVDFRLENPGAYGLFYGAPSATEHFDSLSLELPVSGAGSSVTTPDNTWPLPLGTYAIEQRFNWLPNPYDVLGAFNYGEVAGFTLVNFGNRFQGAIDHAGPAGGVTVAVDRFWENFPKAFRIENEVVKTDLWPAWGNGPEFGGQYGQPNGPISQVDPLSLEHYRFEGGRWKTYRMRFDFHLSNRTPSQVAAVAERLRLPIAGRPPAYWTKITGATGVLFSERRDWTDVSNQRYERMADIIHDDQAADHIPYVGWIGLRQFRNRGGIYGGQQFYGWENFGDIVWGGGYASLHYDWPLSALLRWYRGGDYGYFDVGRDMAARKRDYDTNHSLDVNEAWRGANFYEKGWWSGNFLPGSPSHTWVHGVLLYYAITGDEGSYEAAQQSREYFLRASPRYWSGNGGARIPGWTIDNLVDCYNYLGDQACLVEAAAGIDNFEMLEAGYGSQGYVLNPFNQTGPYPISAKPWMHNIFFNAVARYVLTTADPDPLPLLQRMATWFRTECVDWGGGPLDDYQLPTIHGVWGLNGYTDSPSWHLAWPMMESLSLSALLFGTPEDYQMACALYDLLTRYHQHSLGTHVNLNMPQEHSTISMRMTQYPGSESKVIGNYLRWGLTHQAVRTLFENTFFQ